MRSADITYINLEGPLVSNCPLTDTGMKFCGQLANVEGLVGAGVDVASLANNHASNYGQAGLEETVQALQTSDIAVTGRGSPAILTKNNTLVSFVSFDDISRSVLLDQFIQEIEDTRAISDLVVVTFHWGTEYQATPNARQITLAHTAVDAGADLVIGAHPHWVQSKEIYRDKPIYYSLGNFVFDQDWSAETKHGLAVRFTYQQNNLVLTEELPVLIQNYGQPHWQ